MHTQPSTGASVFTLTPSATHLPDIHQAATAKFPIVVACRLGESLGKMFGGSFGDIAHPTHIQRAQLQCPVRSLIVAGYRKPAGVWVQRGHGRGASASIPYAALHSLRSQAQAAPTTKRFSTYITESMHVLSKRSCRMAQGLPRTACAVVAPQTDL